ncbi:MAG: sensor histidine kinase [Kiloniellales bacterium]
MFTGISDFFSSENFAPHGMCFIWDPTILWLRVVSDTVIAFSYYAIPLALGYFAIKRRDMVFRHVFWFFCVFVLACGTTHLMAIWVLWNPDYAAEGIVKAATAVASFSALIVLWRIMPEVLTYPSPAQLRLANRELERQITQRRKTEAKVRELNAELESRVVARTEELARSNAELQAALHQHEILLQELHHRVKNNLQTVIGLLNIHAAPIRDAAALKAVQEATERIQVIALAHRYLYGGDSPDELPLSDYIRELCALLHEANAGPGQAIEIETSLEQIQVPIDNAAPLALVLNEIISNALRHAFPDRRQGKITVRLNREEEDPGIVSITVADDGIGLPQGFSLETARSTGLRILRSLVQQLNGTLKIESNGGTIFRLCFPLAWSTANRQRRQAVGARTA